MALYRSCAWLQWGRGLTSAESTRSAAASTASDVASMGPRTYIRGKARAGPEEDVGKMALQWGRGLTSAESRQGLKVVAAG